MRNGFKFGLSIATEPLAPSAPVVYRGDISEIIQTTKRIGYDGIELQLRDPEKIDPDKIVQLCKENGMAITAIATGLEYSMNGLSMIHADLSKRAEMRRRLFLDVELAEKFNCPVIIGCVRGNIPGDEDPAPYYERLRDEMLALSKKASQHGVTIVLEAINFYVNNYLTSIRDTCDFIDSLGCDNIKLHIDTHHMAIEESDMLAAVRYAGNRIGYVHFAENNRLYPGGCGVDFWGVMKILREIDYDGYIVMEIVPVPDADTCATRSLEYLFKLSDLVGYRPYSAV